MRNLLWKEWHEQSWKLAFSCIVLGALALIGLHARIVADQTMMMWVCFLGITLLPVLSSTGLIPAERAEGSFESLLAMPIAPWRILVAKTAMGMLLCIGPLAVAALLSLLVAGGREVTPLSIFDLYGRSTLESLSFFLWMLALTARLPSESRAGLVAVGVLILWMLASMALASPNLPLFPLLFTVSPLAFLSGVGGMLNGGPKLVTVLLTQVVILTPLWASTVRSLKNPT